MIFPGRFHSRQTRMFLSRARARRSRRRQGQGRSTRTRTRRRRMQRRQPRQPFGERWTSACFFCARKGFDDDDDDMMMMMSFSVRYSECHLRAIVLRTTTTTTMLKGCGTTILSKCDHSRRVIYLSSSSWSFPALFEHALVGGVQRLQRHSALEQPRLQIFLFRFV